MLDTEKNYKYCISPFIHLKFVLEINASLQKQKLASHLCNPYRTWEFRVLSDSPCL